MAKVKVSAKGRVDRVQVAHKEFADRLNEACDKEGTLVPPMYKGRYVWVKSELKKRFDIDVTTESVRKWFIGEVIPRNEKMRALARLLDVNEGWLSVGLASGDDASKMRKRFIGTNGAVNLVAGFIQLSGSHCALPTDDDFNQKFVDLYSILDNRQRMLSIRLAEDLGDGKFKFGVANEYKRVTTIGVIFRNIQNTDLILIPSAQIDQHGKAVGPHVEVTVTERGRHYAIGRTEINKMKHFARELALAE